MKDDSRKWLSAADCAARTGLTVKALRVYEREGLLKPSRSASGWRRYGPEDLMRLNTISVLRSLGLSLAQIRQLLIEANPSMLSILKVQAKSWRERHAESVHALELVDAAIHRLERNQLLSLEELCQLVSALQQRSTPMQNRATLMTDLLNERLTADELWQWQSWWASHAEDMNQNAAYLRERTELFAVLQELLDQGLSPQDPLVQKQMQKQNAAIARYGVRERTVRTLDWNEAVTFKVMELGVIARERHTDRSALPFPLVAPLLVNFYEEALKTSAAAQTAAPVYAAGDVLVKAKTDPASAAADEVVKALEAVCVDEELGDPEVYLRFTSFIAKVNHQPLPEGLQRVFDFLVQALRLRRKASIAELTPTLPAMAFTPEEIAAVRRAYARQMGLMAGLIDPRVEAAFATVPRENFLGKGPWAITSILRGSTMTTPDDSPAHVYADTVVVIDAAKRLNNGQPSLYYRLFAEAKIADGAHIVHVGAATGYYSALLAHLAGPSGQLVAIEYEPQLARHARTNLQDLPQVRVVHGDATQIALEPADLIVISAGVTRLPETWLDALKDGGQLIVPMTPDVGMGVIFGIRRRAERYFVAVLSPVMIYQCAGARDPQSAAALAEALKNHGERAVTRLYRGASLPAENIWLRGDTWCLAFS